VSCLVRLPARAGALRTWPGGWFVLCLGAFSLIASAVCSLSLGVRSLAVGVSRCVRFAGRLGSLRCVLAVACRCGCGRSERALLAAVCAGRSGVAVACVPLTGDRRWGSSGWMSTSAAWFRLRAPSVLPALAGLDEPPLRRSCVAPLAFYPNPFAFTLAPLPHRGGRQSVRAVRPWMSH